MLLTCIYEEDIIHKFPQFLQLHCLMSTCPNVMLITIMTGVGLSGCQTIFYQPPDDSQIDPQLQNSNSDVPAATHVPTPALAVVHASALATVHASVPAAASGACPAGGSECNLPAPPASTSSGRSPAKSSSFLKDYANFEKAKNSVKNVPQKRALEDSLFDIAQ